MCLIKRFFLQTCMCFLYVFYTNDIPLLAIIQKFHHSTCFFICNCQHTLSSTHPFKNKNKERKCNDGLIDTKHFYDGLTRMFVLSRSLFDCTQLT